VSVIEEERTMEASSTEKRIDDLSGRIGRFEGRFERFEDKVDSRFDKVSTKEQLGKHELVTEGEFARIDARFDKLEARFDRWGRIVAGGAVTVAAAVIAKVFGA
jgi:hypothetical protein